MHILKVLLCSITVFSLEAMKRPDETISNKLTKRLRESTVWSKNPFLDAIEDDNIEKVLELVRSGESSEFALIRAVRQGKHTIVKILLKNGADVNTKDRDEPILMLAAQAGNKAAIEILLEAGVDVNAGDKFEQTALMWAAQGGFEEVIEMLINAGARVDAKDDVGRTAFYWAIQRGHEKAAEKLLSFGAKVNESLPYNSVLVAALAKNLKNIIPRLIDLGADVHTCENSRTPLLVASIKGLENVISLLLNAGASIEAKDQYGSTALMLAAVNGHEKVVGMLLDAGAHVHERDNDGQTALINAIQNIQVKDSESEVSLSKLWLMRDLDANPSLSAIEAQEKISEYLRRKSDSTRRLADAKRAQEKIVILLLASGSDITVRDNYDKNVHAFAKEMYYPWLAQLLVMLENPLVSAYLKDKVTFINENIAKVLQSKYYRACSKRSKRAKHRDCSHQTALIITTIFGDAENVRKLLDLKLPLWFINAQDQSGRTALMYALKYNYLEIAPLLIPPLGKGLFLRDSEGNSPLVYGAETGDPGIFSRIFEIVGRRDMRSVLKSLVKAQENNFQDIVVYIILHLTIIKNFNDKAASKKRLRH